MDDARSAASSEEPAFGAALYGTIATPTAAERLIDFGDELLDFADELHAAASAESVRHAALREAEPMDTA